jgi:hypothetical protein
MSDIQKKCFECRSRLGDFCILHLEKIRSSGCEFHAVKFIPRPDFGQRVRKSDKQAKAA